MERFLSQPFFVAEQFTGVPGKYVPVQESIRGFQEILEGKHDDVPESRLLHEGLDRRSRRRGRRAGSLTLRTPPPDEEERAEDHAADVSDADVRVRAHHRRRRVGAALMAHTRSSRVEVLTPEGEVFNDEVEMVSTRTVIGSIGILANHEPLLAMLDPTELRLYRSDSDIVHLAQGEGYLQIDRQPRPDPGAGGPGTGLDRRRAAVATACSRLSPTCRTPATTPNAAESPSAAVRREEGVREPSPRTSSAHALTSAAMRPFLREASERRPGA